MLRNVTCGNCHGYFYTMIWEDSNIPSFCPYCKHDEIFELGTIQTVPHSQQFHDGELQRITTREEEEQVDHEVLKSFLDEVLVDFSTWQSNFSDFVLETLHKTLRFALVMNLNPETIAAITERVIVTFWEEVTV